MLRLKVKSLTFVRHAEREGAETNPGWEKYINYPSSIQGITKRGEKQAGILDEALWQMIPHFGFRGTSPLLRCMLTAAKLKKTRGTKWHILPGLTEQHWGDFDTLSPIQQQQRSPNFPLLREIEPFLWGPPGGERAYQTLIRFEHEMQKIADEYEDEDCLIVTHSNIMRIARVSLEGWPAHRFHELQYPTEKGNHVPDCMILHYSSLDPDSGQRRKDGVIGWRKHFCPLEEHYTEPEWKEIEEKTYSSHQLEQEAKKLKTRFKELKNKRAQQR